MKPLVAYDSQNYLRQWVVLSALLSAGGLLILWVALFGQDSYGERFLLLLMGVGDLLGFGTLFRRSWKRLRCPVPALVIDSAGIKHHPLEREAEFIGWEEIASGYIYVQQGNRILCLVPVNQVEYLRRQSVWNRWANRGNAKVTGAPIWIALEKLSVPCEELLRRIDAHLSPNQKRIGEAS